jgi:hypothetical protein
MFNLYFMIMYFDKFILLNKFKCIQMDVLQ